MGGVRKTRRGTEGEDRRCSSFLPLPPCIHPTTTWAPAESEAQGIPCPEEAWAGDWARRRGGAELEVGPQGD